MENRKGRLGMIKLQKIPSSSRSTGYFYFPENTEDVGMIEIKNNDVFVAVESNHDKELGVPYYANKARAEVLRLLKSGNLVESKILAWY